MVLWFHLGIKCFGNAPVEFNSTKENDKTVCAIILKKKTDKRKQFQKKSFSTTEIHDIDLTPNLGK